MLQALPVRLCLARQSGQLPAACHSILLSGCITCLHVLEVAKQLALVIFRPWCRRLPPLSRIPVACTTPDSIPMRLQLQAPRQSPDQALAACVLKASIPVLRVNLLSDRPYCSLEIAPAHEAMYDMSMWPRPAASEVRMRTILLSPPPKQWIPQSAHGHLSQVRHLNASPHTRNAGACGQLKRWPQAQAQPAGGLRLHSRRRRRGTADLAALPPKMVADPAGLTQQI
jgi:hypothetical protein